MARILTVVTVLLCAASLCFAVEQKPKATEPVGAVVETGGVILGKIVGATEEAITGKREVTVKTETGETRIFPFNESVEFLDKTFHAVTFNQLKPGEDITVRIKNKLEKK